MIFYNWKNAFVGYKNKKFKKLKNWHFSKRLNQWFCSKNGHFFKLFFLGNLGQEKFSYDILEQKNALLGYNNKKFKKSKNWHFSKGVNPWFCSKNGHFPTFFFRQFKPGKCILWYFRTKNVFLGYKNKKFKKSKSWHFSKGVNPGFWFKNGYFFNLFIFGQYRPAKCLLWYSRTKKCLARLKKQEVQKVEKLTFVQRG